MASVKQDIVAEKQISVRDIALITAAVAFALSYAAKAGPDGHTLLLVHTCIVVALAAFAGIAFRRVLAIRHLGFRQVCWVHYGRLLIYLCIVKPFLWCLHEN